MELKLKLIKFFLKNGYMPIAPILLWNIFLTSKLPAEYDPATFNSNIPLLVIILENIFRSIIFILPLFFIIDLESKNSKKGLLIYIAGSIAYYCSWLMLIFASTSAWSKSIFGFTAPSYTPIIWLIGTGLMAKSYYFKISYSKWHYIIPASLFTVFHFMHTVIVYMRSS